MNAKNKSTVSNNETILDFIVNNLGLSSPSALFEALDELFFEKLHHGKMIVFSVPNNQLKNELLLHAKPRIVWNERYLNEHKESGLNDLLSQLVMKYTIVGNENKLSKVLVNNEDASIFYLGSEKDQQFLAVLLSGNNIDAKEFKSIIDYSHGIFRNFLVWEKTKEVESLIYVDDVTGLYNQRKLKKDIEYQVNRFDRCGEDFIVLFIDIDHFKTINDNFGHLIGTKILTDMGDIIKDTVRGGDLSFRYGGDEFVVIVPNINYLLGCKIANRILNNINKNIFKVSKTNILASKTESIEKYQTDVIELSLSVSIGVASYSNDADSARDILTIADEMMYHAKEKGRGRVCGTAELLGPKKLKA